MPFDKPIGSPLRDPVIKKRPLPLKIAQDLHDQNLTLAEARRLFLDPGEKLEWCAAFVLYCFKEADDPIPGNHWKNRAVWHLQDNLEHSPGWATRVRVLDDIEAGDILIMRRTGSVLEADGRRLRDNSPGHVGFAEGPATLLRTGATAPTVEGNIRGTIKRLTRPLGGTKSGAIIAAYRRVRE